MENLNKDLQCEIDSYFKENGFETSWDSDNEFKWVELYIDNSMVLQIDYKISKRQFIDLMVDHIKGMDNGKDIDTPFFIAFDNGSEGLKEVALNFEDVRNRLALENIKEYVLENILKDFEVEEGFEYEYYDEDGYCGGTLFAEILNFWENFNTDEKFKYLVSGEFMSDDIDLDGGRSYFLSDGELLNKLFTYMTENLKCTKEDYEKVIYNSLDIVDEMYDRYRVDKVEKIEEKIETSVKYLKCITTKYNHYNNKDILKVGEIYKIVDEGRIWEDKFLMIYVDVDGQRFEFAKSSFEPYKDETKIKVYIEWNRIKAEVDIENRDRMIKAILESCEFKEMKIQDHPDYIEGGPSGTLFYMDFKYKGDDE